MGAARVGQLGRSARQLHLARTWRNRRFAYDSNLPAQWCDTHLLGRRRCDAQVYGEREDAMEILGLRSEVPRRPVGQILTHSGHPKIALVDLGRDASRKLRASWPAARPFQSGGVLESAWLLRMLGAGSTAGASLLAGNVFLATANPATLMTIGAGVGSAVMGPTGSGTPGNSDRSSMTTGLGRSTVDSRETWPG